MSTADIQERSQDSATGRAKRSRLSNIWRHKTPYLLLSPAISVLIAIIVYPIFFNAQISLHNTRLISSGLGNFVGLANYRHVFQDDDFWHSLRVSLAFAVATVVFSFIVGFGLALLMNEIRLGRPVLLVLLMVPWVISPVVTGYSWRAMFNDEFGFLNKILRDIGVIDHNITWLAKPDTAVFAVIMASIWRFVPYMMIMLLAGLQSVPRELYEAAEIDGAGVFARFRDITVSELRYLIAVIVMFGSIWSFNDFTLPYIMTQGGPAKATNVLPIEIYNTAFTALRFGRGAALAVIVLLLLLVANIVYVRRLLREDVTARASA